MFQFSLETLPHSYFQTTSRQICGKNYGSLDPPIVAGRLEKKFIATKAAENRGFSEPASGPPFFFGLLAPQTHRVVGINQDIILALPEYAAAARFRD